jgi:hypothetical protein
VTRVTGLLERRDFINSSSNVSSAGIALMTDDESALYQRAKRLGYNVRRTDGEYTLTAIDGSNGCVGGTDIERIQQWLDQIERGSAS